MTGTLIAVDGQILQVAFGIDDTPQPLEGLVTGSAEAPVRLEVIEATAAGVVRALTLDETLGLRLGLPVVRTGGPLPVPCGQALLGRIVGPTGDPLDGGPPIEGPSGPLHPRPQGSTLMLPPDLVALEVDHPGIAACPIARGRTALVHAPDGADAMDATTLVDLATCVAESGHAVVIAAVSYSATRLGALRDALGGHPGVAVIASRISDLPLTRARTVHAAIAAAQGLRRHRSDVVLVLDDTRAAGQADDEVHVLCGTRGARRRGGWDLPDTRPADGMGALTTLEIHPPVPAPVETDDPFLGRLRALAGTPIPVLPHADVRLVLAAAGVGVPAIDPQRSTSVLSTD